MDVFGEALVLDPGVAKLPLERVDLFASGGQAGWLVVCRPDPCVKLVFEVGVPVCQNVALDAGFAA